MATAKPSCQVHRYHWPPPLTIVEHHIQPRGMGGPDTPDNRVPVCDTGHRNIHDILAWYVFDHGPEPRGTRREHNVARAGWQAWVDAGCPGNPHAAYAVHPPSAV